LTRAYVTGSLSFVPRRERYHEPSVAELIDHLKLSYYGALEVAGRIGVSSDALSEWLSGKANPSLKACRKIRAFLESLPERKGNGVKPVGFNYRLSPHLNGVSGHADARSVRRARAF
jgi:transcriptional regulator with XRE-family HTH domain